MKSDLTDVRKSVGRDRMTFKATFPNGDVLTFNISRTRDSWGTTQPATAKKITREDLGKIVQLGAEDPNGNHVDRYTKMEKYCRSVQYLAELAELKE